MSAASNYLENKVLDHVLRYSTAPYVGVSTLYLALFNNTSTNTAANLEAGTLTDETSTSSTAYSRKAITFGAASSGTSTSSATVTFDTATANWGTITHVAVMDGATEVQATCYSTVQSQPARPLRQATHSKLALET
jgi:hypothetical protein